MQNVHAIYFHLLTSMVFSLDPIFLNISANMSCVLLFNFLGFWWLCRNKQPRFTLYFHSMYHYLWKTAGKLSNSLFPHSTIPIDIITLTESVSSEEPFISFLEFGSFFKLFCKNILTSEFSEASIKFSWPRIFKRKIPKHTKTIYKTSNESLTH